MSTCPVRCVNVAIDAFADGRQFIVQPYPLLFVSFSDPNESLVIVLRELDVLSDWKSLGLQLGLNYSTLTEIQASELDPSHCKMAMLHLWLSLRDGVMDKGGATKAALVKALYTMKENVLAHRIETKGLSSSHSPAPTCEFYTAWVSLHIKCNIHLQGCDLHVTSCYIQCNLHYRNFGNLNT